MSDRNNDPVKEAPSPRWEAIYGNEEYDPMNSAGPGGRTTNIENNEKGILDSALMRVIARNTTSELTGSDHQANRRGVY